MVTRVSSFLVALALLGLVAGCSEAPTAQYDAGMTAIQTARTAEAELYAPALLRSATDSLNAAMVEIQAQDGKFFAFRDYDRAAEIIAAGQTLAEKAAQEAAVEKEKMRVADSVMITEIEVMLTETKTMISTAPRGKGSRVDLKVMEADLDAASMALTTATGEYTAGRYLAARDQLSAVKSQVTKVRGEIETAMASMKKK